MALDTIATLCTKNYHFSAAIAKQHPHCVSKIFIPGDYSPIIISGIIQDDEEAITTDLPIAFQCHPPYLTKDGSQTSFVTTTGPQVSMKVLGLLMIKATCMIIDTIDN
jgi:hypothetical protein